MQISDCLLRRYNIFATSRILRGRVLGGLNRRGGADALARVGVRVVRARVRDDAPLSLERRWECPSLVAQPRFLRP